MAFSFHRLLLDNQTVFKKRLFDRLKDPDLTRGHPRILDYLKEHDGQTQKQIAQGCHIEPPTLTVILNGMEEKGIIQRKMLNGNRRFYYVFLTEKGKRLQKKVEEAFLQLEQEAFENISEADCAHFMNTFIQIYYNITRKE